MSHFAAIRGEGLVDAESCIKTSASNETANQRFSRLIAKLKIVIRQLQNAAPAEVFKKFRSKHHSMCQKGRDYHQ